ncbi:hypothetical protein KIK06_10280 [Nocardiopsis sp. EMB25]|nr:hypothetical protein [Nocardiopsis sp. EMB25]MCY9784280.1 hypothetical protein [Nocardiopsis sp. EMB25]
MYVKTAKRENGPGAVRYLNPAHKEGDPAKEWAVTEAPFIFGPRRPVRP